MRTEIFAAKFDQLDAIRGFAAQAARDAGMDDSGVYAVELSMDEACTNIIEHAYEGLEGGEIECTCNADAKKLTIIIHDHLTQPVSRCLIWTPIWNPVRWEDWGFS
jgi:serine/threonine-protein kinase RsbW